MSNRSAEGAAAKTGAGAGAGERRGGAGQRVQFEALVAMADAQGGSGFEAESVDVSSAGMRLRTAYLPPVGEKLVCRFDSAGSEIAATGEVIWRNELARGGEFGLRFTELDREASEALRSMCAAMTGPEEGSEKPSSGASKGTRVRLHIEGLGSPMKARVREADTGEVLVGSNLEFLRVGRTLELEDVDHGVRREAHIDHVKVEIDSATNIPQLVVSLRYREGDKKGREGAAMVGSKAAAAAAAAAELGSRGADPSTPRASRVPAMGRAGSEGDPDASEARAQSSAEARAEARTSKPAQRRSQAPRNEGASASANASESESEGEGDEERSAALDADDGEDEGGALGEGRAEKLRGLSIKAAAAGKKVAGTVGPSLAAASAKTKGALLGLMAAIQRKRAERVEVQHAATPRRMTAPPPTGALRSEGRKLVRDDGADDIDNEDDAPAPPRTNKRAAIIGSALGLFAVLAIFGLTRFLADGKIAEPVAGATDAQSGQAVAALTAAPSALAGAAPSPSGALTADVPLFGATPLSTTEPVPSAPPDASALGGGLPAGAMAGVPGAPGAVPGGDPMAISGDPALDDSSGDDGDEEGGGASATGKKEWGQGKVRNPVMLRIKMDGPIETLNGGAGAMGFTISLPGRRSLSSTSELARKDKRIASLQVVNNAQGAEVTVQFKDGIPAYVAKAKGDKLEIALGTEGRKKVAAKASGDTKKQAAKKKEATKKASSKKEPAKKDAAKKTTKKKPAAD
jgi:hypothetical protein